MHSYSFEKLNVWQETRVFVKEIYTLTKAFPKEEQFGLVNQLRRASVSIASNIAEGTSRKTNKDQAKFTTIAYSSLMEVINQLILSNDLGYIKDKDYQDLRLRAEKISTMLNALRNFQSGG
jgi:four helix bundle protein